MYINNTDSTMDDICKEPEIKSKFLFLEGFFSIAQAAEILTIFFCKQAGYCDRFKIYDKYFNRGDVHLTQRYVIKFVSQ